MGERRCGRLRRRKTGPSSHVLGCPKGGGDRALRKEQVRLRIAEGFPPPRAVRVAVQWSALPESARLRSAWNELGIETEGA